MYILNCKHYLDIICFIMTFRKIVQTFFCKEWLFYYGSAHWILPPVLSQELFFHVKISHHKGYLCEEKNGHKDLKQCSQFSICGAFWSISVVSIIHIPAECQMQVLLSTVRFGIPHYMYLSSKVNLWICVMIFRRKNDVHHRIKVFIPIYLLFSSLIMYFITRKIFISSTVFI